MKAPNEYDFIMLSLRCQHIRSRHIHDADSFIICVCNSIFIAFTTICSHLTNTNFTLLSLSDYKYIFFVCLFLVFHLILFLASVENHFCMWFSMDIFFFFSIHSLEHYNGVCLFSNPLILVPFESDFIRLQFVIATFALVGAIFSRRSHLHI